MRAVQSAENNRRPLCFVVGIRTIADMINTAIVTTGQFELQVCRYRLWLHLGWTDGERENPQAIDLDICIKLHTAPLASQSDQLEDGFCYASLLDTLSIAAQAKPFKLLEHLAATLVGVAEQFLRDRGYTACLSISVTKVSPPVPGLLGGVRVTCHNSPQQALS
jgi:7,8-dihydroneopterin aldolase/epimerase/oxygenase